MKTAIIGVGRMGRRHIGAVRHLGWDVVGVFDMNEESLKLAQDEHRLSSEQLFQDAETLFAKGKPECVIIATTADSHCALTCMAVERGAKNILVEKPMAVSLAECDQMVDVCARAGVKLAVNHQMRFMPQYTEPKRMLSSDDYGQLASMNIVGGNFGFAMNGTHYFEAFRVVSGETPVEVTAWFSPEAVPNPRGPQFRDSAGSIRAVTASGKRLNMEISADQGHGVLITYAARNGTISVNEVTRELISSVREEQYRELPTTRYAMPSTDAHLTLQAQDIIEATAAVLSALASGVDNVSGEDGRRVIELLVAAYHSAENGNVAVRVDRGLDRERVFPWA